MHKPNLRTLATSLIALTLPVTLLVSVSVAAYFKSTNPDNVDVTQELAYLGQTLVASVVTFSFFVIVIVALIAKMYRANRSFVQAKLPMYLLAAVLVLTVGILLANNYTSSVEDKYLIDHGRPTLQQYFDQLESQKKQ